MKKNTQQDAVLTAVRNALATGNRFSTKSLIEELITDGTFDIPSGYHWDVYSIIISYRNRIIKAVSVLRDDYKCWIIGSKTDGYYLAKSYEEWLEWCGVGQEIGNSRVSLNHKRKSYEGGELPKND